MPKDSFSSYRPISLISCLSKCLEKIINSKLIFWAEQNSILPDCQAGFRKKNSCQDHILKLNQHITEGLNKQQITTCVMFDLEKAFDKASHAGILLKLKNYNLPLPLYNWIKGFHHSRKAIQLRTHLSNEALYQQHPDSNGTASTISRHKTRPETFLQRTSNAHIT